MHQPIKFQFDTAELKRQWPIIAKSRLDALKKMFGRLHAEISGLSSDDPPELFRFFIGRPAQRELGNRQLLLFQRPGDGQVALPLVQCE
jgi:hypothetical protein